MARTCPSCKSFNARRSTVRTSEITLRHFFFSPYRCRDCRTRFWVVSRNVYYLAGCLAMVAVVVGLAWNALALFEMPQSETESPVEASAKLTEMLKLAQKGDPVAEFELSRMYANGYGVPQNLQEEQKWLERAARHGNVHAQYEYAVALRDGHGTIQDYQAARKWMQLAAEGNSASAQLALGQMYRTGLGMPVDNVKAYVWFNVAAAQGAPGATAARDAVLPRLTSAELQEAQAESRRVSELYAARGAQPTQ